ncbi:hypothetical protein D0Z08_11095 [Nocardioides immobilis]|uniref:Uncharacterized protein n=1 Tax=Nocardioides immobilis TaxID=2049295 RepID=A0A417Y3P4_9ACTN|nr:hypothetical protein D0Z08_11095 [Nocardioides immobilis]
MYEGDDTPDPEPAPTPDPPNVPYGNAPQVPYGQTPTYNPVVVTKSSAGVPKLALVIIGVAVLGGVAAAAAGIFAAVGGPGGIGGIDAKDPDDFAEMVEKLEDEKDTTVVTWVGLYTDYIIVDVPYTDDPSDDREISYTWRGGDLEEWTKGTSTDARFDLKEIDPSVIDGMCDPVLAEADGAEKDDCYVFISKPAEGSDVWFRTSASDEFGKSWWVNYDKDGNEVDRGHS